MKRLIVALIFTSSTAFAADISFTGKLEQGGLAVGTAPPGSTIEFQKHTLQAGPDGRFVLGFDRDAPKSLTVKITPPGGTAETRQLAIAPRKWDIERINGLPETLVTPDPTTLAQIAADSKLIAAAYARTEASSYFENGFIRPAEGRTSGIFGSQRILNGEPRAAHAGMDIAAPEGTPVHAAADGIVSLAHPGMVLNGNVVILEHGYGLHTIYIHLSRIDVTAGQKVKRGDVIGAIGKTGRATGPNLHYAVTWFNARLDPDTVMAVLPAGP